MWGGQINPGFRVEFNSAYKGGLRFHHRSDAEIMRFVTTAASKRPRTTADPANYAAGANIAGFIQVADAMLALGVI